MVLGFEDAVSRHRLAVESRHEDRAFTAVFEALNWGAAIDDRLGKEWVINEQPMGKDWRSRIEEARILAGLRFARNRCQHQWANALVLPDGHAFPIWTWRSTQQLPSGRPDPAGETVYRDLLEGRPVQPELDVMWLIFKTVQKLIGDGTGSLSRPSVRARPGRSQ